MHVCNVFVDNQRQSRSNAYDRIGSACHILVRSFCSFQLLLRSDQTEDDGSSGYQMPLSAYTHVIANAWCVDNRNRWLANLHSKKTCWKIISALMVIQFYFQRDCDRYFFYRFSTIKILFLSFVILARDINCNNYKNNRILRNKFHKSAFISRV